MKYMKMLSLAVLARAKGVRPSSEEHPESATVSAKSGRSAKAKKAKKGKCQR